MKLPKLSVATELKRIFRNEDSRFIAITGLKVSLISMLISGIVYLWLYELMRLNHMYFKANGFPDIGERNFYDYLFSEVVENLPIFFLFHICLFFIGSYVGWLILRPFRIIAEYAEAVIENPNLLYRVEEFNTYKLLTRFSEFFFEFLRESRRRGVIHTTTVPPQFSRIHKPVTDRIFMLHFGLLMIIIAVSNGLFIIESAATIFHNMSELAGSTLNSKSAVNFVGQQIFILDDIIVVTISMIAIFYFLLGLHLYEKVSGAAFGIFSTMRSFMKGNHFSRVHLVGYSYVREYTRKLNKYLDFIQNNLNKEDPKG